MRTGHRLQVKERIHFVAGLRKGLNELDNGEGIAHNVVKEEFQNGCSKNRVAIRQ